MLQEPSDKFHRLKAHGLPCFPLTVFIGKPDGIIRYAFDAVIGNSHTEDISGQVAKGVLPFSRSLTIGDPLLLPNRRIDCIEELSLSHSIPEFRLKDFCQGFWVNKKILS